MFGTAGGPFFLLGCNKQAAAPISKSACSGAGGKTRGQQLTKLKIDPAEVFCGGTKWLLTWGGQTRLSQTSKPNKTWTLGRPLRNQPCVFLWTVLRFNYRPSDRNDKGKGGFCDLSWSDEGLVRRLTFLLWHRDGRRQVWLVQGVQIVFMSVFFGLDRFKFHLSLMRLCLRFKVDAVSTWSHVNNVRDTHERFAFTT